jgi:hypothetical protein
MSCGIMQMNCGIAIILEAGKQKNSSFVNFGLQG